MVEKVKSEKVCGVWKGERRVGKKMVRTGLLWF